MVENCTYAVNLDCIQRLTPDNLILWNESVIPVSRSKFSAMKELLQRGGHAVGE